MLRNLTHLDGPLVGRADPDRRIPARPNFAWTRGRVVFFSRSDRLSEIAKGGWTSGSFSEFAWIDQTPRLFAWNRRVVTAFGDTGRWTCRSAWMLPNGQ